MTFRKINFKYLGNRVRGQHHVSKEGRSSHYITRFRIPDIKKAYTRIVIRVDINTEEDGRQSWEAIGKVILGMRAHPRGAPSLVPSMYTYRRSDGVRLPRMDHRTIHMQGLTGKSKSRKRIFKEAMRLVLDAMWSSCFLSDSDDVETHTACKMYDLTKGKMLSGV